jgi:hypothetical protein
VTVPDDDALEREIDELYATDPDGFTAARDAIAKRLKADGDDAASKRVKALRKPVRSAWAVNRLVREERASVQQLIDAGQHLRTAQRKALSGAGSAELRERSDERRRLVSGLAERAPELIGDDRPTASLVEDVSATLEAASADDAAAARVLEGRLDKPLARPSGFGEVFGLTAVPGGRGGSEQEEPDRPSAAEERRLERERERDIRSAETRERAARAQVDRLRREIAELQERVSERKERLRAAEAEARGAAVDVRRLKR